MKKGKVAEKILETIKNNSGITKGKLEDIYPHTTVWRNIYSDNGSLKNDIRIEKNSVGVDTYYSIKTEGDIPSEHLHFLMESYRFSSTSSLGRTKQEEIISDIHAVCHKKKIRNKEFIKFLIEYSKKRGKWDIDFSQTLKQRFGVGYHDNNIFWMCLGAVALKLVSNIESDKSDNTRFEEYLLELIRSTRGFFEKVIFDFEHTRNPSERILALDVLRKMMYPKIYDIAFKLLENVDAEKEIDFSKSKAKTEFDIFRNQIESLIFSYAKIDPTNCRKRLYSLLDAILGSEISDSNKHRRIKFNARELKIKDEIMYLLEVTRKGQY